MKSKKKNWRILVYLCMNYILVYMTNFCVFADDKTNTVNNGVTGSISSVVLITSNVFLIFGIILAVIGVILLITSHSEKRFSVKKIMAIILIVVGIGFIISSFIVRGIKFNQIINTYPNSDYIVSSVSTN